MSSGVGLSPYLLAVDLDELSYQLGSARVGCTMGNMVVKHLIFADDTYVFSPSVGGLQPLLNIFGDYAAELEIALIATKKLVLFFLQNVETTSSIKCFSEWCEGTVF